MQVSLESLEHKENVERGLYGSQVATQNELASHGNLYPTEDIDFERLSGPRDSKWTDVEDTTENSYSMRDMEVFFEEENKEQLVDFLTGKDFYFEIIDIYRKMIYKANAMWQIDWLYYACDTLDYVVCGMVEGWRTIVPARIRLEKAFKNAENRLLLGTSVRATLVKQGRITPIKRKEVQPA